MWETTFHRKTSGRHGGYHHDARDKKVRGGRRGFPISTKKQKAKKPVDGYRLTIKASPKTVLEEGRKKRPSRR